MVIDIPILAYPKQGLRIIIETDSSYFINNRVLSYLGKDRLLHFVLFFSKNLNSPEYSYKIYNKQVLAIIWDFEQWKPKLKSIRVPIKVIIDHKSLEYFMTLKKLSKQQIY